LFELETDKATTEIASPADGVLVIAVTEGQTVPVGAVVGRIEDRGAKSEDRGSKIEDRAAKVESKKNADGKETGKLKTATEGKIAQPATPSPPSPTPRPPSADLNHLSSTSHPPTPAGGPETRERMSAIRLRIAEKLVAVKNQAAILTTFNEA